MATFTSLGWKTPGATVSVYRREAVLPSSALATDGAPSGTPVEQAVVDNGGRAVFVSLSEMVRYVATDGQRTVNILVPLATDDELVDLLQSSVTAQSSVLSSLLARIAAVEKGGGGGGVVTQTGELAVAATPIAFVTQVAGAGTNPPTEYLTLQNVGAQSLSVTISDDAAWLTTTAGPVTITARESAQIALAASAAGLASGTHSGTVTLTPSVGAAVAVPVSMVLTATQAAEVATDAPRAFRLVEGAVGARPALRVQGTAAAVNGPTLTVTNPAVVADDLILFPVGVSSSGRTASAPTGYVIKGNPGHASTLSQMWLWMKRAVAADAGPTTVSATPNLSPTAMVGKTLSFQGVDVAAADMGITDLKAGILSTAQTAQTTASSTADSANSLCVAVVESKPGTTPSNFGVTPAGWTKVFEFQDSVTTGTGEMVAVFTKPAEAGNANSLSLTLSHASHLNYVIFSLRPTTGGKSLKWNQLLAITDYVLAVSEAPEGQAGRNTVYVASSTTEPPAGWPALTGPDGAGEMTQGLVAVPGATRYYSVRNPDRAITAAWARPEVQVVWPGTPVSGGGTSGDGAAGGGGGTYDPGAELAGYTLRLNESFGYTGGADTALWAQDWAASGSAPYTYYRSEQVTVSNGTCKIKMQRGVTNPAKRDNVSGLIHTSNKFEIGPNGGKTAVRWGMRARCPGGQAMWPAFWLHYGNDKWPPEVDIIELVGHHSRKHFFTYHFAVGSNTQVIYEPTASWHDVWHVWEFEMSSAGVGVWYLDGVERMRRSGLATGDWYIIVNMCCGGPGSASNWVGPPTSSTPDTATMEVDWVRCWSK